MGRLGREEQQLGHVLSLVLVRAMDLITLLDM